jgi:hypothetical protein
MIGGETIGYHPSTSGFQLLTNVASNGTPPTRHREHDHHAGDKRGRAESTLICNDNDAEDEAASSLKEISEPARWLISRIALEYSMRLFQVVGSVLNSVKSEIEIRASMRIMSSKSHQKTSIGASDAVERSVRMIPQRECKSKYVNSLLDKSSQSTHGKDYHKHLIKDESLGLQIKPNSPLHNRRRTEYKMLSSSELAMLFE